MKKNLLAGLEAMANLEFEKINELLKQCSVEERREIYQVLRKEFPIHSLEGKLNTSAEVILEAIDRSSDLTLRGVRGVVAEAAFKEYVMTPKIKEGWQDILIVGNPSYDFIVEAPSKPKVRIQVKMQRMKDKRPMRAIEASKKLFSRSTDMWVVETQKTRGGKDGDGNDTRPYRFGEFDILAVSLHPCTNDWAKFFYTVADWLIPDPRNSEMIFKYQPVAMNINEDWTDKLEVCIGWFGSNTKKYIRTDAS